MKPTFEQISAAFSSVDPNSPRARVERIQAILAVIDEAWEQDGEERERIVGAFMAYGRHHPDCGGSPKCTCGYDSVREALSGRASNEDPDAGLPTVDDITGILSEESLDQDLHRHNAEQRRKREGYATALEECGYIGMGGPRERAAARYPLRKRVPKAIPDPHGFGQWRTEYDENARCMHAIWREGEPAVGWQDDLRYTPVLFTLERVRALVALLNDPWTIEEDYSVEEVVDG